MFRVLTRNRQRDVQWSQSLPLRAPAIAVHSTPPDGPKPEDVEPRTWKRKATKVVIFTICAAIGVWQSSIIAAMFLAYPVRIDIRIARPENLNLPAISVCFDYIPLAEKMAKYDPNYKWPTDIQNAPEYVNPKMTVQEYSEVSATYEQLIAECVLFDVDSRLVNCTAISEVNTYVNRKYKCFTWFERSMLKTTEFENREKKIPRYDIDDLLGNDWVRIKVHNLHLVRDLVGVSIHSPDAIVQPDLGNPSYLEVIRFWFETASVQKASFTYSTSESNLKKKPYASDCMNYKTDYKVQSKRNGIENCTIEKFLTKNEAWPWDVLASDWMKIGSRTWNVPFAADTTEGYASKERSACSEEYKEPDCVDINYSLHLKAVEYGPEKELQIVLYAPSGNEVKLFEMPRYEFIEVLSYVAGIISLWVGISMVSLITPLIPYFVQWFSLLKVTMRRDKVGSEKIYRREVVAVVLSSLTPLPTRALRPRRDKFPTPEPTLVQRNQAPLRFRSLH